PIDKSSINDHFMQIEALGIKMDEVLQKQIDDGLKAFKEAFKEILEAL
ncbi:MAG TPA: transaldolase, partial [Sulfurimonas autotrophica]|nr:transaldolase [Sulfurimonas autotrophica]